MIAPLTYSDPDASFFNEVGDSNCPRMEQLPIRGRPAAIRETSRYFLSMFPRPPGLFSRLCPIAFNVCDNPQNCTR